MSTRLFSSGCPWSSTPSTRFPFSWPRCSRPFWPTRSRRRTWCPTPSTTSTGPRPRSWADTRPLALRPGRCFRRPAWPWAPWSICPLSTWPTMSTPGATNGPWRRLSWPPRARPPAPPARSASTCLAGPGRWPRSWPQTWPWPWIGGSSSFWSTNPRWMLAKGA